MCRLAALGWAWVVEGQAEVVVVELAAAVQAVGGLEAEVREAAWVVVAVEEVAEAGVAAEGGRRHCIGCGCQSLPSRRCLESMRY